MVKCNQCDGWYSPPEMPLGWPHSIEALCNLCRLKPKVDKMSNEEIKLLRRIEALEQQLGEVADLLRKLSKQVLTLVKGIPYV